MILMTSSSHDDRPARVAAARNRAARFNPSQESPASTALLIAELACVIDLLTPVRTQATPLPPPAGLIRRLRDNAAKGDTLASEVLEAFAQLQEQVSSGLMDGHEMAKEEYREEIQALHRRLEHAAALLEDKPFAGDPVLSVLRMTDGEPRRHQPAKPPGETRRCWCGRVHLNMPWGVQECGDCEGEGCRHCHRTGLDARSRALKASNT
jgi:hypothetical protein